MSDELPQKRQEELPKWKDLLEIVKAAPSTSVTSERAYAARFNKDAVSAQIEYVHLQGWREHYKHKGRWSNFLMFVMAGMVVFQSALLGLVGGGVWDFSQYKWLLPALLVQNLAQVIGLAVFVVKALFRDVESSPKSKV